MELTWLFIANSIAFGVALAMDAFSVSLVNGMNEPDMKIGRKCTIAGVFACFQTLMPLLGWLCVHTIAQAFEAFQVLIPWIALVLLVVLGGRMLWESRQAADLEQAAPAVGLVALMAQGVATSIDALSVGFTIASYDWQFALIEALIIGVVTFALCFVGLEMGRRFGTRLAGKANILGGIILIAIGIEIFVRGIFGL